NVDAIGYDPEHGDPLYKHIPFYMKHASSLNHTIGIFCNNAANSQFDFGRERSGYWNPYTSLCVDAGQFDLYFCLGPTPADVLKQYHQITGFPAMPTKKSLGYLGSSMTYTELDKNSDQAILGFIKQCEKLNIPISGFHLSSGYTTGEDGKRYAFNWNKARFANPQQFVEMMTEAGQVLSPNIKPGLLTTHPLWQEFDEAGAFIRTADDSGSLTQKFWGGEASFVDFSNPAARNLWKTYLKSALLDFGVTSVWNDNNEFELGRDDAQCHVEGEPVNARELRPYLANLMAECAYEALEESHPNTRPFVLSRAGYAGIQKYAQTWSGDNVSSWEHFHYNIATMLGMSLSGVPLNGMDIGGFAGPAPSPEMFLRWVQNGIFHPRFSIHSVNSDNTVTEPWLYPSITSLIQKAIQTRYMFLPEIYAAAARAHFEGTPVVAPLFYFFPNCNDLKNCHTQFMLGDALMCIAITEPNQETVSIYFPPGRWRCFYTGQDFAGNSTVTLPLSNTYSPLFYRAGHGFMLDTEYASADLAPISIPNNGIMLHLDARQSGSTHVYDDDGESLDYQIGSHIKGDLVWRIGADLITASFIQEGTYQTDKADLIFRIDIEEKCPHSISINNNRLEHKLYADQFEVNSWYFDAEKTQALIWAPAEILNNNFQLELSFQPVVNISAEMDH
ncbi:MAG: TIM-barrel domain-containing protein, partial [Chloroflexota bacterium]